MVTLQEYEAQRFSSAFKQDPIGCRSKGDAIEVRWPFAAHQTGTLAIQRATTRHGGPLTCNKLRALIAGCLEVDLGRVTDNAHLSRDLGADRVDRLELMILVEEIIGVGNNRRRVRPDRGYLVHHVMRQRVSWFKPTATEAR